MPRVRRGWHADPYVSPFVQHAVSRAQSRAKTTRKPKPQKEWNSDFQRKDLFDPKLKKREIFKPVPGKYMANETPVHNSTDRIISAQEKKLTTRTNKDEPVNNPYKRMQHHETFSAPTANATFHELTESKESPLRSNQISVSPPASPSIHTSPPFLSSSSQSTPLPQVPARSPSIVKSSIKRVVTRSTSPIDEHTVHSLLYNKPPPVPHRPPPVDPPSPKDVCPSTPLQEEHLFSKMMDMQLRTQELNNQANEVYMTNMMRLLDRMLPVPPGSSTSPHTNLSHRATLPNNRPTDPCRRTRNNKKATPKSEMMSIVLRKLQEIEAAEDALMRKLDDDGDVATRRMSRDRTMRHAGTSLNNAMSIPSEIRDAKPASTTPIKSIRAEDATASSPAYDISRAPRITDTHEISPLYRAAIDQHNVGQRRLFQETAKHFAEDQQQYYKSLVLAQSDPMQQQECDKYRKDLKNACRMRELRFREHGTTVCELGNRFTERLLDDLLEELTDELDGVFDDYASKCIEKL